LILDWYWEICPVTQVTGLFFATFVALASPILVLAALQAFFKEFGDEQ
jgi:hypothetical protein